MMVPQELNDEFVVQFPRWAPNDLHLICQRCGRAWYMPQDESKRTRCAMSILCEHVERHADCA